MASTSHIATAAQEKDVPSGAVCAICRRQFSKYTCPVCNIPYCSLTCFRNEAHNQCSEGFYKKQVESDIYGQPSASAEERRQMMEVLKRFEEEAANDTLDGDDGDADDEEDDLAARLNNVDLDSVSADELWELLSPEQRARFAEAVRDPASELAQSLLALEEAAARPPWWAPAGAGDVLTRPAPMRIPARMVRPLPAGQVSLVYNFVAVCLAYAYCVRHSGLSCIGEAVGDDVEEARRLIRVLAPFLGDKRSRTVFSGLEEAVTDVWSRMGEGARSAASFATLLQDTAVLLRPMLVVPSPNPDGTSPNEEMMDSAALPQATPILVLSDLGQLFEGSPNATPSTSIGHKLLFYAAHLASTPPQALQLVAEEARARAIAFQREAEEDNGSAKSSPIRPAERPTRQTPVIEELS